MYVGDAHAHTFHGPLIELPQEARAFVRAFDHRSPVQPFTFDLDIPQ